MGREVSESCVDSLLTEMVSSYCDRFYANKPDHAARRIEAIGFQVGLQLSERYTMEWPRFSDHLEAIKFICKDFWSELFKKQIENLKTNHRAYVARFCMQLEDLQIVKCGLEEVVALEDGAQK